MVILEQLCAIFSDFEAFFKCFFNSFDHFGSFFIVKLSVRTAEEVLERANSSLRVVLEQLCQHLSESGVRTCQQLLRVLLERAF